MLFSRGPGQQVACEEAKQLVPVGDQAWLVGHFDPMTDALVCLGWSAEIREEPGWRTAVRS